MTAGWESLRGWWRAGSREAPATPRTRRAVIAGTLTAGVAAAVTAIVVSAGPDRPAAARFAVAGVALLAGAVARWPSLITPALLGLGAAALVPLGSRSGTVSELALVAGLLVAAGELAGWADDLRSVVAPAPGEVRDRASAIAVWVAVSIGAAASALAVAGLGAPDEEVAIVLGGAATLLVLSFAALRRWRQRA